MHYVLTKVVSVNKVLHKCVDECSNWVVLWTTTRWMLYYIEIPCPTDNEYIPLFNEVSYKCSVYSLYISEVLFPDSTILLLISGSTLACKVIIRCNKHSGGWFNKKMPSYQYRKSHCGDKTILRPSYLHNGISYTGKMTSLYWIRAQFVIRFSRLFRTASVAANLGWSTGWSPWTSAMTVLLWFRVKRSAFTWSNPRPASASTVRCKSWRHWCDVIMNKPFLSQILLLQLLFC